MKLHSVFFKEPAPIAAVTMSSITMGKEGNRIESIEWTPPGIIIRAKGYPRAIIVGHANVKSAELEDGEDPRSEPRKTPDSEYQQQRAPGQQKGKA